MKLSAWEKTRMVILVRDVFVCAYCMDDADQIDHIVPVCQGGTNHHSNLLAACGRCNQSKGGLTPEQWFERDGFTAPPGWDTYRNEVAG